MEENNQNENETKSKFEQKQYEEEEKTLEQILGGIGLGWKMSIIRVQPGFASGWLETIPILPDKPIDMDYLGENHGGKTLRLQIKNPQGRIKRQMDVDIADHPKKWGKRILHPDELEEQKRMYAPPQQDNSLLIELIKQTSQPQDNSVLIELIKQLNNNNNTQTPDNTLVTELMKQKESSNNHFIEFMQSQIKNGNGNENDMKNFMKMATQMKDVNTLFGNDNNSDDTNMAAMGNMVDKYMSLQLEKEKLKLQKQTQSPNHQPETQVPELPERTGQLQQQTQQQTQQQQPQQSLANISDLELINYAKTRLDSMDEPTKHQILEQLMGESFEYADEDDETEDETEDENTCGDGDQPINFTDAIQPGQQIDSDDASCTDDTGPT